MQASTGKCALACCATILVSGCAMQRNVSPEYRLSSSAPATVAGGSMLQRGRAQLDAGLDALAIEAFRAEIRTNPESADAYNGLAVAYGRIGRDDLAQRYFETALAKDPANGKAQANLARLTGEEPEAAQFADANVPAPTSEPVAIVTMAQADPIGQIIDSIESPALASSIMIPQIDEKPAEPIYTLARQGVLSSHFATAPVRFATIESSATAAKPYKPVEPPKPLTPSIPIANLPADYRATGTRLIRVSLGEVHLVTRPEPPTRTATIQPEFKSFGDRLATWLPQSIAVEQAASGYRAKEGAVLMAAIERAGQGQKIALGADVVLPELPEFAYVSFDAADDIAQV